MIAQMLAGEDDRPFGLQQLGIAGPRAARRRRGSKSRPIAPTPSDQGISPQATVTPFVKQVRLAGMERLDRFPADAEPLLMAETRERLRVVRVRPAGAIGGDQHALAIADSRPTDRSHSR